MKKGSFLLIAVLLICLLLPGCDATENARPNMQGEPITQGEKAEPAEPDTLIEPDTDLLNTPDEQPEPAELMLPVMEWWELYNPNGFDTVTALILNPNDVAIDVTYDLVFYKNGSEVSRIEYCLNESILPGHEDIIWANVDVPCCTDADDVRMENITVTETCYPPVEGSYDYKGIVDGEVCYDFKFEKPIEMATIFFVLYNDNNGNGKFDKGEIVVVCVETLLEQEGSVSYETDGYPYTNCLVVFKAY